MKQRSLLFMLLIALCLPMSAQQKVRQYFTVTDGSFNVNNWGDSNTSNPLTNSFTIGKEFDSVAWNLGGMDFTAYDKLYLRFVCSGNNCQFRIFDTTGGVEYYEDIQENPDEEVELSWTLSGSDADEFPRMDNSGDVDMTKVNQIAFWNYWNTGKDYDENGDSIFDPSCTITIKEMYLERTLANGEKDYVELTKEPFAFTDANFQAEDPTYVRSSIDATGNLNIKENQAGGLYNENGMDWSAYKYLVVVPQKPFVDGDDAIKYTIADVDGNEYEGGNFRYAFWNTPCVGIMNLSTMLATTADDDHNVPDEFAFDAVQSLNFSLWGGVKEINYGISAIYLSNTMPAGGGGGDNAYNTANKVISNSAADVTSTICLPFAAAICGAKVYEPTGVDDPQNPSELYCKQVYGVLTAGKPYIIVSNSAKNILAYTAGANQVAEPVDGGMLKADNFNGNEVAAGENYAVLNANGEFEAVTDDNAEDIAIMNANTAYLNGKVLTQGQDEGGLVIPLVGLTAATDGIKTISTEKVSTKLNDGRIYTLSGMQVKAATQPGIYIKNSRKFIVK